MAEGDSPDEDSGRAITTQLFAPIKAVFSSNFFTSARKAWKDTTERMNSAGEYVHDAVEKPVRSFFGAVHKSPGAVIVILFIIKIQSLQQL